MSQAQVEKFVSLVTNHPEVLRTASKGVEEPEEFIRNVVQYAATHGYDFTEAEAKAWIQNQAAPREAAELSDLQLEMVAGGKGGRAPNLYLNQTFFNLSRGLVGNSGGALAGNSGAGLIGNAGASFARGFGRR